MRSISISGCRVWLWCSEFPSYCNWTRMLVIDVSSTTSRQLLAAQTLFTHPIIVRKHPLVRKMKHAAGKRFYTKMTVFLTLSLDVKPTTF